MWGDSDKMNAGINKLIKASPIELNFFYPNRNMTFKSYEVLKKFIEKEYVFWNECRGGVGEQIFQKYNNLLSNIGSIEEQYNKEMDENWFVNALASHIANYNNGDFTNNFYSESPLVRRFKELYIENTAKGNAFISYVKGVSIDTNIAYNFSGAIEADRYLNQKMYSEKFNENYNNILHESVNECWNTMNEINAKYNEDYVKSKEEYTTFTDEINNWKSDTEKELQENISDSKHELDTLIDDKRNNLEELEELYNEKLKLESPAKYWLELEKKYKVEGSIWLSATVLTSVLLTKLLLSILYEMPQELKIANIEFSLESLRSTLLLTIIISIGIYLLRLFVKMALSAYHLSRDAKERYQLSYFYLSLIKESAIDSEDRAIVLQSLFSRADTGLLKGDSSPAFPVDGMLAQVLKNIK